MLNKNHAYLIILICVMMRFGDILNHVHEIDFVLE